MFPRALKRALLIFAPLLLIFYGALNLYVDPDNIPPKVNHWIDVGKSKWYGEGTGQGEGAHHQATPEKPTIPNDDLTDVPGSKHVDELTGAGEKAGVKQGDEPDGKTGSNKPEEGGDGAKGKGSTSGKGGKKEDEKAKEEEEKPWVGVDDILPLTHHIVNATSSKDGKFVNVHFSDDYQTFNPNVIPHPTIDDTWIVVAQLRTEETKLTSKFKYPISEMVCSAVLENGVLRCNSEPTKLPVASTKGGQCKGDLRYFNLNEGPHDARLSWGPDAPYLVFGENSEFACFGLFAQDFRELVNGQQRSGGSTSNAGVEQINFEPEVKDALKPSKPYFKKATDLQRPPPWGVVEKNWFLFWDSEGSMYIHHDIEYQRVFAKVKPDGSVGRDLGAETASHDASCIEKYMPKTAPENESIHQASNSLRVILCKRLDPDCKPSPSNTVIITIYQYKTFHFFHGVYEPYIMAFYDHAPFGVYGMSTKPIWLNGRQTYPDQNTTEMVYVTSINWKEKGRRYEGYLDDELFVGFGVNDRSSAVVDILAGDLLQYLEPCNEIETHTL